MSSRIRYEVKKASVGLWFVLGVVLSSVIWCVYGLEPVWHQMAAGEGLYDALARYVGGVILGSH